MKITALSSSIFLSIIALLFNQTSSLADYKLNPEPLSGWTHNNVFPDDSPNKHGIILSGGDITFSSPVIAEIDGDTTNGKEVAVGGSDGKLYVYKSNGKLLWAKSLPTANCSELAANEKLLSSPAVGELYGDGVAYVVVGYGGRTASSCEGGVAAFRGDSGKKKWIFSTKKWAAKEGYSESYYSVLSSPALADVDGNGTMEIGFGSLDRNVYLLNNTGKVIWYYHAADTVWSSPAFADINGDGRKELIIGTDITENNEIKPPTKNGGYVQAISTKPRNPKRIDFQSDKSYIWRKYFNQVIYSSPVVADVLPSNSGDEIIVGSGCFFPEGVSEKKGKWIKILRLKDGRILKTLKAPACIPSSVAVADLDEDGVNEVVAIANGDASIGGDGFSRVLAWKPSVSSNPIWNTIPKDRDNNDSFGGDFASPVIADVDGNGSLEVLVSNFWSVHVLAGKTGVQLTCKTNSPCGDRGTLFAWKTLKSTPAVGDIDGDGVLDVVVGGGHVYNENNGMLYGWTNIATTITSASGTFAPYSTPWPMFRGNPNHAGILVAPAQ